MSEIQSTELLRVEKPRTFVRRVLAALAALLVFTALITAMIAVAYCSAPTQKRQPPIRGPATPAGQS